MTLHIHCSAYYLKLGNRVLDKITSDYNPPRYWFRIKVSAKGRAHQGVEGHIMDLWWKNHRRVKNFDPLVFLWINEPLSNVEGGQTIQYFKPDIHPGRYELAGLVHAKLPMKPVEMNQPLPKENIPDHELAEVEINQSTNEPAHMRKRRTFPYGVYYIKVAVADSTGERAKQVFKVWAFRDASKCKIRKARFYERWLLAIKGLLPAI